MDPNEYSRLTPLDDDELLEKLGELQMKADGAEGDWEDLKSDTRDAKKTFLGWQEKVAQIGRAAESAHGLYLLKDDKLTEERPDDDTLDFGEDPLGEPEEPADTLIEEVLEAPVERVEKSGGRIYPAEQDGQVYQGKTDQGNTCTVKKQAGGWYGRVSGKPVSTKGASAAVVFKEVEVFVKQMIDWNPTITLDDPEDVAPKPDPEPEQEDLTGGL